MAADIKEELQTRREEAKLALFIDFENIALGVREAKYKTFEINRVLERLVEKGRIVFKKAYADWDAYAQYKRPFHEEGIELVYIPRKAYSGKNSADIRMVVDAMDLSASKDHIDMFVIISGDSDFSPLVSKLKENDKYVVGVGVKNSSSALLIDNCDEFIFYEDLVRETTKPRRTPQIRDLPKQQMEAFDLITNAVEALQREDKEIIWGSMVKQTIKRKHPQFNENYHGYSSFSKLLEDAEKHKLIGLKKDVRSGTYIVLPEREGAAAAGAAASGSSGSGAPGSPGSTSAASGAVGAGSIGSGPSGSIGSGTIGSTAAASASSSSVAATAAPTPASQV